MSLNLIELLTQQVSAIVLEGDSRYLLAKNNALSGFYPVLLAILKAKPDRIQALQNQLKPTLFEVFHGHLAIKSQFLQQVSGTAPQTEIEQTLNLAIAPTLGALAEQAGTQDPEGIQHLLQTHAAAIQQSLPDWATALIAGLGVNTAFGENLNQMPPAQQLNAAVMQKSTSGWLLSLLALLILALLVALFLLTCDSKKEPITSTSQLATGTEPAVFQLSTGAQGDLVTCQIYSGDLKYIQILQTEVKHIFNHPAGCGAEHHAKYHQSFIDQEALPSVLKLLKGVPDTAILWQGSQILVQSGNAARAQAIVQQIQKLTPHVQVQMAPSDRNLHQVLNQQQNAAIHDSVKRAEQALARLDVNQLRPLDIATALNLQIINFASGSAEIPELNQSVLSQAAVLIQRVPNVHVTIMGHTDGDGDHVANKLLSQKRAQAVADYFIAQGIDPGKVSTLGYGEEQPIADNATEEGKFKNRRIEFRVENTETGMVNQVDASGVTRQPNE